MGSEMFSYLDAIDYTTIKGIKSLTVIGRKHPVPYLCSTAWKGGTKLSNDYNHSRPSAKNLLRRNRYTLTALPTAPKKLLDDPT